MLHTGESLHCVREASGRKRPSKRRRSLSVEDREELKNSFCSEKTLARLLVTTCRDSCKRGCLKQFRTPERKQRLQIFRREWAALHKLDQDNVVSWCAQVPSSCHVRSVPVLLMLAKAFQKLKACHQKTEILQEANIVGSRAT